MIPRKFHWVWLGPDILPEKDQNWIQSWLTHNPTWEGHLWTDIDDINIGLINHKIPYLINQRIYNDIEQWVTGKAATASRSDIVRYEIIAREGGVYLDTDVEAFKPLGIILDNVRVFAANEWGPRWGNFMFGAVSNHPAMWTIVRDLAPYLDSLKEPTGACSATGPLYFGPKIRGYKEEVVIFPHMLFNPLCAEDDPNQVEVWPECSIANHHFDGKWYDRIKNKPPKEFLKYSSGMEQISNKPIKYTGTGSDLIYRSAS